MEDDMLFIEESGIITEEAIKEAMEIIKNRIPDGDQYQAEKAPIHLFNGN